MVVLQVTVISAVLLSAGCFKELAISPAPNPCAAEGDKDQRQPLQAPALMGIGNLYLTDALGDMVNSGLGATSKLEKSNECFDRALRLAPDNYEAQLSIGVTYLARARLAMEGPERSSLLQAARHMLGSAYMLRHGAYEPLYYLAEVAVAEHNPELARKLVEPLQRAHVKDGPVNALLGYLDERDDRLDDAREAYRKAIAAGWPAESLSFATARLAKLGDTGRRAQPVQVSAQKAGG